MNRKLLSRNIGQQIRVRPVPWRVDGSGHRLTDRDDQWTLDAVDVHPVRVRIHNIATGHTVELASDNVAEWRSPGFLLLRCQLILRPRAVDIEPINRGSPLFPSPPKAEDLERPLPTSQGGYGNGMTLSSRTPLGGGGQPDLPRALESLRSALTSVEASQAQLEHSRPCPKCRKMTDRSICPNCRLILRCNLVKKW